MSIRCHHLDKWSFMNLDLVEEILEKHAKAVVLVGGSTSSGKSFCAHHLRDFLNQRGHPSTILSTDSYNRGVTAIITDKVEENDFDGSLPDKETILSIATPIVRDTPFEDKFDKNCCRKIAEALKEQVPDEIIDRYIKGCSREIKKLNFDEPTVYDLKLVAQDIGKLLNGETIQKRSYSKVISERVPSEEYVDGSAYQVFIVEGIYVLSDNLLKHIDRTSAVTDFVEGSSKSLFLRRVIRDAKTTSASNAFTIAMYFNNIVKSYKETILPSSRNADIIFKNDISFEELREGNLYTTKEKIPVTSPSFLSELLSEAEVLSKSYQKDLYIIGSDDAPDRNNLLRMREISSDEGRTYVPSSLVHKGSPKTRKDGREIRPINILLEKEEFQKVFRNENDFLKRFSEGGLTLDRTVYKIKWKIRYRGLSLTLSSIGGEGFQLEFTDPETPRERIEEIRKEADPLIASSVG